MVIDFSLVPMLLGTFQHGPFDFLAARVEFIEFHSDFHPTDDTSIATRLASTLSRSSYLSATSSRFPVLILVPLARIH